NIYIPTLFAYDESGCVSIATDTVKLYRPTIAGFYTPDTLGCTPYTVQFTDTSKYAVKYIWDFGDSTKDTAAQPIHVYTTASPQNVPYKVTLTAISDKGCSSMARPVYINVHEAPKVKI